MDTTSNFSTGKQIGDYRIGDLIAKGVNTLTWSATQVSVQREVIICSLADNLKSCETHSEEFISDVRTKASVDHPLISSVLEAINDDTQCFFAMEKLQGSSLDSIHDEGSSIPPLETVRIIRNIAGAYQYLENHDIATLPISAHDIVIDSESYCRLINMAVSGKIDPSIATRDKELIGHIFQDLLEPGQPGSTRTASLLDYMADLHRDQPLSWEQIYNLSDEVERQLTEPKDNNQIQSLTMKMPPRVSSDTLGKAASTVAIIAILAGLVYYFSSRKAVTKEREMSEMVRIPAGKYLGPDGTSITMKEFWIDAHEVSIGEYAKFLHALEHLAAEQRSVYQHEDQPQNKLSHEPDDWYNLITAANNGTPWNNLEVDLNYPVVGVDWWDAYTYAEWKGRRLPTREEWYTACTAGDDPSQILGSGWSPVDQTSQTSFGIYGMAGNVSEWMRKRTLDPADLSKPARYIISGASYLRPKYGARAREWVADRNLRRADLGFRTFSTSLQNN